MQTYARRQPAFQNRRAVYGQPSIEGPSIVFAAPTRPSGDVGQIRGHEVPWDLSDILGSDGLWYTQQQRDGIRPSGQTHERTAVDVVGDVLGLATGLITSTIHEGNVTQRQELHDAALERIAQINANNASISDPLLREQNQRLADALALVARQAAPAAPIVQQQQGMSQNMQIGIGVVALVVVAGVAYVATRKNPTESPNDNPSVLVYGQKRFISAREFEKLRRRLAQRHAA